MGMHTYQIRVRGHVDERRFYWYANLSAAHIADGDTLITAAQLDQAALHALLSRIRDLGLELLGLQVVPPPADPTDEGHMR
jgi:hypothetical protein